LVRYLNWLGAPTNPTRMMRFTDATGCTDVDVVGAAGLDRGKGRG
jgi:hypothetical protein